MPPSTRSNFDFHMHTDQSDGFVSPAAVWDLVSAEKFEGVSITDHDTLDAYTHFSTESLYGDHSGDTTWIVPGVEFSTRMDDLELHVLGYFPGGLSAGLHDFVKIVMEQRDARMAEGIRQLQQRGVGITVRDCLEVAGGRVLSRSHVEQVLVAKRYVTHARAAYRHLLSSTVFPIPTPVTTDVIGVIGELGGISVWAHPYRAHFDRYFETLVSAGLQGIEVYNLWRRREEVRYMEQEAQTRDLVVTGGSDWHGRKGSDPLGSLRIDSNSVAAFLQRLSSQQARSDDS